MRGTGCGPNAPTRRRPAGSRWRATSGASPGAGACSGATRRPARPRRPRCSSSRARRGASRGSLALPHAISTTMVYAPAPRAVPLFCLL
jgi:hypothetical protein